MKVWACCIQSAYDEVKSSLGIEPVTSPPIRTVNFDPKQMEGNDLLYFRLHGLTNAPSVMFGEDNNGGLVSAIVVEHIQAARLDGAVVVLANCYGATSPFVEAFYKSGAAIVIAGGGPNYAGVNAVIGTDLLVRIIAKAMSAGLSIKRALKLAKLRLSLTLWRRADRDALAFRIIDKGEV